MDEQPTVLLVEDDPLVLDAAVETLVEGGCTVWSASNYGDALDALKDCPQGSILVTDIVLDGPRTGLELVEEAHSRRPDLGIIILSGEIRPDSSSLPGKSLFCTKPCAPGALLDLVKTCQDW